MLGVYVALKSVLAGRNVPLPLVVHIPEPFVEEPPSVTTALLAQTV